MKFGQWLKTIMAEKDMTLQDLEDLTGFSKANLSLWTRNRMPQLKTVEHICEELDCEIIYRPKAAATKYDAMTRMNKAQMARVFCDFQNDCKYCPATDYCRPGHNGFASLLDEEV